MESIYLLLWLLLFAVVIFTCTWIVLNILKRGVSITNSILEKRKDILALLAAIIGACSLIQAGMPENLENFFLDKSVKEKIKQKNKKYQYHTEKDERYRPYVEYERKGDDLLLAFGMENNPEFSYNGEVQGFKIGNYNLEDIPAGIELINDVNDFLNQITKEKPNKKFLIHINIIGQADGIPSKHSFYKGEYGKINNLTYYS